MVRVFDTQLKNVAYRYAQLLGIRITRLSLWRELEENPFYPTLFSLTKTFSKFNVPNNAFKINQADFEKVEAPFLAWIKINVRDSDFVLVTDIAADSVSYIYKNGKTTTVSRDSFFSDFKGIVWVAQPTPGSGERGYEVAARHERQQRYRRMALIAGALFIFLSLVFVNLRGDSAHVVLPVMLLMLAGLFTSIILLMYEVDKDNRLVKSICATRDSHRANCDAVLNSKASKLFGIGLGELSFFYFSATLLLLLFPVYSFGQKLPLLAVINACALPVIPFSIYYQWRVAKQWCKLCLATVSVLILEFVCFLSFYWPHFYLPAITVIDGWIVALSLLLPIIGWYGIKQLAIKANRYNKYYPALRRWENDGAVFNLRLSQQPAIAPGWENAGLTLGNPEAKNIVVTVSDLYCNPCAGAHAHIHQLLHDNTDVRLVVIFTKGNREATREAKHLLAVAANGGGISQALAEWYANHDYQMLTRKYPQSANECDQQAARLEAMFQWCSAAKIEFTPTIYVNGFTLPGIYGPEDLQNLL